MNAEKLTQFQCKKEGTLFYFQHTPYSASRLVCRCPVCGSRRVNPTGREYPPLDENRAARYDGARA